MAAIETTALTKRFGGDVLAVSDLDLTVEHGEVFGFLGPNGAGKSTTINMLLDFVRPTSGSATVLGHDVHAESETIRERIGVLPEGATLYDRLTGVEHIEWVSETKGVDVDPYEMLDRVGLDEADGGRAVSGYSKGMQQRLGFGMALVGDPELLILDEPSTGLDPTGMQEMRDIISDVADDGTTVFFSSHILGEVEAICDRIGIMNEGELVATGTLEELGERLNLGASITLEVDPVPAPNQLREMDAIRGVETTDSTVTATVADPSDKIDVVQTVANKSTVQDILSEDTSLEELFNTYTNGDEPAADGESEEATRDAMEVNA
jgi:ABC-2 type transport system ATP-binding protein